MKKFAKILTLVLVLAIVCGVVALAVTAADATTGNLTVSNSDGTILTYVAQDFSGAATNKAPDGSMGYNSDPVTNTSFLTTTNGNQHFWYQRPATTQHAWAGVLSGPLDSQQDPTTWKMIDYDYVVVDFDFSSNAYVDYDATYLANGKGAWKLTETPDADSRLAYRPFRGVSMTRFWVDSKTKYGTSKEMFKVFADGNKWFIGDMNDTNAFELPSAKNEWTHISVIYEIDNSLTYDEAGKVVDTGLDNTKAHVYVNGSYLVTVGNIVDIDSYFGAGKTYAGKLNDYINKIGFQQIRLQGDSYTSDVSLCVDNIATHYYKKGYDGDLANFVKGDYAQPIVANSDVVYSSKYVSLNGVTADVDGKSYFTEAAIVNAIKTGSVVTLGSDIAIDAIYDQIPDHFTVVTNGHNCTFNDIGYTFAPTETEGTYAVTKVPELLNDSYAYLIKSHGAIFRIGTDIKKLMTDYDAARALGNSISVKLGTDVNMADYFKKFSLNGTVLDFDLNGYDILHSYVNTTHPQLFALEGSNSKLNLYSSRPGSEIISLSYDTDYDNKNGTFGVINTAGIITATGGGKGNSAKFGNGTDNLTIHTSILAQVTENFDFTIDGGKYYAPQGNSTGFIISKSANGKINLDFKNAEIRTSGARVFAADNVGCLVGSIDNCTIFSNTHLFSGFGAASEITITNSDVAGTVSLTAGKVIIGDRCRINFPLSDYITVPEGYTTQTTKSYYKAIFNVYHPQYDKNTNSMTETSLTVPKAVGIETYFTLYVSEGDIPTLENGGENGVEYIIKNGNEIVSIGKDINYLITEYGKLIEEYGKSGSQFKDITVILGADLHFSERPASSFKVTGGWSSKFDLNGYDITLSFYAANDSFISLFEVGDGGNLEVYSSREGSDLISLSVMKDGKTGNTATLIKPGSNSTTTIGNGTNYLSVHTSIIMLAPNPVGVTLNLNGGSYFAPRGNSQGMIGARTSGCINLNINNVLIASNGATIFTALDVVNYNSDGTVKSEEHTYLTGTIKNSTLIAPTGNIFYYNHESSNLTLENCTLIGNTNSTGKGKITLKEGCKYTFNLPTYMSVADGYHAYADSTKISDAFYVFYPRYDANLGAFTETSLSVKEKVSYSGTIKSVVRVSSDIVTVDGVAYKDYDVASAFAAIKDNSRVELLNNITTEFTPKADFVLVSGGYSLAIAEDSGYVQLETDVVGTYDVFYADDARLEKHTAYVIYDKDGTILFISRKVDNLLVDAFDTNNKKQWTVKLYDDVDLMAITASPADADCAFIVYGTMNFDVNGHKMYNFTSHREYQNVFRTTSGATLNLYSSKPGAEILSATVDNGAINARAVIHAPNRAGDWAANVNIGGGTDNLSIYAPWLLQVSAANSMSNAYESGTGDHLPTKAINLNIDGGTYVSSHRAGDGMIVAAGSLNATIKNATIISTDNRIFFTDTRYPSKLDAEIDNCNVTGSLVKCLTSPSTIDITNSTFNGVVAIETGNGKDTEWAQAKGTVTFGAGVRFASAVALNDNVKYADGLAEYAIGEKIDAVRYYVYTMTDGKIDASSYAVKSGKTNGDTVYSVLLAPANVYYMTVKADGTRTYGTSNASADVIAAIKALTDGATFVLLSDLSVNEAVKVGAADGTAAHNMEYSIDFNGHTYTVFSATSATVSVFDVRGYTDINVYSSRAGAKVFNVGGTSAQHHGGAFILLQSPGNSESDINVGEYKAYSGDNLSVYAPNILQAYYAGEVNIKGGLYHSMTSSSAGVVILRNRSAEKTMVVNIEDATIISKNMTIFCAHSEANAEKAWKLNVKNSIIYSTNSNAIFGSNDVEYNLADTNAEASFVNCYIIGSTFASNGVKAAITSLAGTKFSKAPTISAPEGEAIVKTNETYSISLNFGSLSWIKEEGKADIPVFTITPTTATETFVSAAAKDGDYSEITWKFLGQSLAENWLNGVVPVYPDVDLPADTEIYKFVIQTPVTVTGDATYEVKQRANFTILMNLTLYSDFVYNVYLPTEVLDYINAVTVNGEAVEYDKNAVVTINGAHYVAVKFDITAANGANTYQFIMNVDGYGGTTFNHGYNLSIPKYAAQVLAADYDENTDTLMNTTLAYVKSATAYFGTDGSAIGDVTNGKVIDGTAQETVDSDIKAVIYGAQLNLESTIKFRFTFAENASGSVTFTYSVKGATKTETINTAEVGEYYEIELRASDLLGEITVTVGEKSCTYSLANYIYYVNNTTDEIAKRDELKTLLYNMYAYAEASAQCVYTTK